MFNIDNLESYIQDALNSWHGGFENVMNPAMKFFGENGELVDYLAKCAFKPNFVRDDLHIIAEAGDAWYYWRILAKIYGYTPEFYNDNIDEIKSIPNINVLALMAISSASAYAAVCGDPQDKDNSIRMFLTLWLNSYLVWLEDMEGLDFDLIHEYNVNKLAGPTNHGWKPDDTAVSDK